MYADGVVVEAATLTHTHTHGSPGVNPFFCFLLSDSARKPGNCLWLNMLADFLSHPIAAGASFFVNTPVWARKIVFAAGKMHLV